MEQNSLLYSLTFSCSKEPNLYDHWQAWLFACVDASPLTAELPVDCEQSQTPSHLAGSWLDLTEGHTAAAAGIYCKRKPKFLLNECKFIKKNYFEYRGLGIFKTLHVLNARWIYCKWTIEASFFSLEKIRWKKQMVEDELPN